ncbi:hypothetical protein U1Q18_003569 [Sarracenia purpurea var. burkii]
MKKRERKEKDGATNIWDCDSPLYDSYELVSLSHVIERHITAAPPFVGGSRRLSSKVCHSSAVNPSPEQDVGASGKTRSSSMAGCFGRFWEKKRRKRMKNGGRAEKMKKVNGGFCNIWIGSGAK